MKHVKRKTHVVTGKTFSQLKTEMLGQFISDLKFSEELGLSTWSGDLKRSGKRMASILEVKGLVKINRVKSMGKQIGFHVVAV